MRRIKKLREYVDSSLDDMRDLNARASAFAHLYEVSLAAAMIAGKRGLDPELASMAGMLHDLYAYESGSYEEHAKKGAKLARQVLVKLDITDESETGIIVSAISHHDDKAAVDAPMDEVLKDADVISHCLHDPTKAVKDKERARFDRLCAEFGMSFPALT